MIRYAFVTMTFLLFFFFLPSNCQICTKRVIITRWQEVSYQYTYRESYHGQCWYGCIKTRIATLVDFKQVPKKFIETRQICCDGYRDVSSTYGSIDCQPICMPSCRNGYCQRPGVCECNDGYVSESDESHICEPVCLNGCLHGSCVEPDICQCDSGYTNIQKKCEPICTEDCKNGFCTAPDTCACWPGYRRTENNTCEPYCFSGCPNGYCFGPDSCRCNNGWVKDAENETCVPYCENACGNGTCVSPNTCECYRGYEVNVSYNETSNSTVCVPSCDNCINGSCTAPNECICEPPLISKTESKCHNSSVQCKFTTCLFEESTTTDYSTSEISTLSSQGYDQSSFYEISTERFSKSYYSSDFDLPGSSISEQATYLTESVPVTAKESATSKHNLTLKDKKEVKTKTWIYATILSLVLAVAILIIIGVAKRNSIKSWMKGGSYVVQDQRGTEISSPSKATVNM